jgi:YD repeat-containing protein
MNGRDNPDTKEHVQMALFTTTFLQCLILLSIMAVLPTLASAAVTYTYDIRHRLTSAAYENGVTISYSYDTLGNRLSRTSTGLPYTVYEDAEDGSTSGWDIYDNDPSGAAITNIFDTSRGSRVIEFSGSETANGYRLRNDDTSNWQDSSNSIIEWSMQFSHYVVYIAVQTRDGFRYIYYTPSENDNLGDATYIHHGLGNSTKDGTWQTVIRDLAYDLKEAQPDNELEAILGFLVRGSGRVDDIRGHTVLPATLDSDGDGITDLDEINIYGTHPYRKDTDGDGMDDGDELLYWGDNWNGDIDGDGIINLLDPDSDGDGFVDGIEVKQGTDPGSSTSSPTVIVYEDAEHGHTNRWDIYDSDPSGAFIDNIYDSERDGRVIEFTGSGTANGFRLRDENNRPWNDTSFSNIQWSMHFSENFVIYIAVQTRNGFRYLYYTPVEQDNLGEATYIHHGLGRASKDGSWRTIIRDLSYDLKEAQPDNELEAVLGFFIRGSGRVDDIMTRNTIPEDVDSDGDGITDLDEINIYGTHPYRKDSDGDGMDDGDELLYWGDNWNGDIDSDGIINLLDPDSDGDGFVDGVEVKQGTDPANPSSYPTSILYEDGEDTDLSGWDIYDHDPEGATIVSVYDHSRNSRVIEFTGSGTANGYRLRNSDFSYWYDTGFTIMEWSMRYEEGYVVYIAAQTKNGFRYIYYTPAETDQLGSGTYVHHGLGSGTQDGSWHTILRNLEDDLQEAQPDNELEAVLGFLIRGSGRVDDIRTRAALPAAPPQ